MTKRELVEAMAQYPDDMDVCCRDWPIKSVGDSYLDTEYDGNFERAIDLVTDEPAKDEVRSRYKGEEAK